MGRYDRELYASNNPAKFGAVDDRRLDHLAGDRPERGIENYDGQAGPLPDGDRHDDPEEVARAEEVRVWQSED